ncbi:twin-arginine translocase TatA/TatE family subunit [Oerskovia enterophila]|uniref:Sec-independent protein translocase protein TatB n=1 Tax=Oerskovia enterophila TaxID=43678 RepID=A0A163SSE5_9CELL|nr:twin-arginine translocase TatA/TatE family subunit [Oerskovia enterophila]KZM36721.1 Sec-independent protein translocase protein TatB [Oerskovia enterophila]OCI31725.1 Sec-independent protein translocase protein TatB [Oerskovia enterophila]
MFGINGAEFVVLLVVAVIVIGPERLPRYAEQLGAFVRTARGFLKDAKSRVDEELGPEVGDVDWSKLDPRQYDPRRIVREALLDDDDLMGTSSRPRSASPVPPPPPAPVDADGVRVPAPFDDEAT